MELYDADLSMLRAFARFGIGVVVALLNELFAAAASRSGYVLEWVQDHVVAYYSATQITAAAVGNEVFVSPLSNFTALLVSAMTNVHAALACLGLDDAVVDGDHRV